MVPSDDRRRFHDDQSRTPAGPQLQQPCPQEAIERIESNAHTLRPSQHIDLVAQSKDLFRVFRPTLQFMSEDRSELQFLSPDQIELKSMEGQTTRYRRAVVV